MKTKISLMFTLGAALVLTSFVAQAQTMADNHMTEESTPTVMPEMAAASSAVASPSEKE